MRTLLRETVGIHRFEDSPSRVQRSEPFSLKGVHEVGLRITVTHNSVSTEPGLSVALHDSDDGTNWNVLYRASLCKGELGIITSRHRTSSAWGRIIYERHDAHGYARTDITTHVWDLGRR